MMRNVLLLNTERSILALSNVCVCVCMCVCVCVCVYTLTTSDEKCIITEH